MIDFLTHAQILWIREHAELVAALLMLLCAALLTLVYRWLSRRHPDVARAIDEGARDYWRGMGFPY